MNGTSSNFFLLSWEKIRCTISRRSLLPEKENTPGLDSGQTWPWVCRSLAVGAGVGRWAPPAPSPHTRELLIQLLPRAALPGKPRAERMSGTHTTPSREVTKRQECSLPAAPELPGVWGRAGFSLLPPSARPCQPQTSLAKKFWNNS